MNRTEADLLIIGGGVLGTFYAWHASQRGLNVILLERHAAPRGATVRNFGQVVPSGLDRLWQKFGRESVAIYKSIQKQFDITVRHNGTIYLASDDDELQLLEELHSINAEDGYPSELWTPSQCRVRYPQLRADYCRGGLFFPDEVSVNPRTMIHRLHQFLGTQPNIQCCFQTCVSELTVEAETVTAATTDGRVFRAKRAIVCSGAEFQTLFPELFTKSELQAVQLQMLRLKPQPEIKLPGNILTGLSIRRYESFSQCPSWSEVKARHTPDPFLEDWGVHILFKQEVDGGIILGDSHEYTTAREVDHFDFDLRQDINDCFLREARKILNLRSWVVESAWTGMYCQTNDPSGIFKKTVDQRIHIVTGIGGKGMTSSAGFSQYHLREILHD